MPWRGGRIPAKIGLRLRLLGVQHDIRSVGSVDHNRSTRPCGHQRRICQFGAGGRVQREDERLRQAGERYGGLGGSLPDQRAGTSTAGDLPACQNFGGHSDVKPDDQHWRISLL